MIYDDDINRDDLSTDEVLEEIRDNAPDRSEVYEESEEGIAYSPNNPGSHQQMKEAEKIIGKEGRDEQA